MKDTDSVRSQNQIVADYLEALATAEVRSVKSQLTRRRRRLSQIDQKIAEAQRAIDRLHLLQERERLVSELAATTTADRLAELEIEFAAIALDYSEAEGISYSTWREIGVPIKVLDKAMIRRTRRSIPVSAETIETIISQLE